MHVPNPDTLFGPITLTECSNTLRKTDTFRSQSQLESLRRTFWRGDASDAGEDKKEQSIGDDSQTRNQSDGSGSDDESELRKDKKKKQLIIHLIIFLIIIQRMLTPLTVTKMKNQKMLKMTIKALVVILILMNVKKK